VQFVDRDDEELDHPVLWQLHAWRISTESWQVAKARADKRRVERWLFQANVEIIQRAILRVWLITPDQANVLAHKWLTRNDEKMFEQFKVKLKTKEEEL
jgi:hypothetical protein